MIRLPVYAQKRLKRLESLERSLIARASTLTIVSVGLKYDLRKIQTEREEILKHYDTKR